ncbi:MAG: transglutaminase family protein [Alphaproteobacteria bacterium]|nr:transglutaminase family protein [Alphaproteobacteria bacterium]
MEWLDRGLKALRHPLRWALTALAVEALIGDFASGVGGSSAQLAVLAGLLAGEGLGRSRLRTSAALGGLFTASLLGLLGSALLVGWPACTAVVGAKGALLLEAILSFGASTFLVVGGLRLWGRRHDLGRVAEAVALTACFASSFAAHRQGAIGRPLWLGDMAWSLGVDPSALLLALAGLLGVAIAALMLLESRLRLPLLGAALIPVLALFMILLGGRVAWQRDAEPQGLSRLQGEMEGMSAQPDEAGESGSGKPQGSEDPQGGEAGGRPQGEGQRPEQGDGQADAGDPRDGDPRDGDRGQGGGQPQQGDGQGGQPQQGDGQGGQPQQGDGQGGQPQQGDGQGGQPQQGDGQGGQPQQGDGQGGQPQQDQGDGGGGQPQQDQGDGGGGQPQQDQGDGGGGQPQQDQGDGGGQPQQDQGDGGGQAQQDQGDGGGAQSDQPSEDQSSDEGEGGGSSSKPSNPVAVVLLEDDHVPPGEGWYLRQDAWSDYSGSRMLPSAREDMDLDVLTDFPTRRTELAWAPPEEDRARVRATVALLVEHTAPFSLDSPVAIEPVDNPNRSRFVRAYAFEAMAWEGDFKGLLGRRAGDPEWSAEQLAAYTEPPEDPRYAALAEEMLAELSEGAREDPFAQALAMKLWLDERMTYSKAEKHEGVPDPTADFLFGNLTGYCTHTAHALTYLMRTRGLPARVAGGYLVEETERRGSTLLVLDHQAHAWAELYLEGRGWVPIDVSPAEVLDPPAQPLDEQLIEQLSQMARGEDPDQGEEDEARPQDAPRLSMPDLSWVWPGLRAFLEGMLRSFLVLFLPTHWGVKLWRRLTPAFASTKSAPRLSYRAALDRLSEQGLRRAEGETRERFARRVTPVSSSFRKLTDLHLRAALGAPGRASAPKAELRAAEAAVSLELRQATPTWRWLLGLLNPFSIYGVR